MDNESVSSGQSFPGGWGVKPLLALPAAWAGRQVYASSLGQLTFGELREAMLRCARLLREHYHVKPGDRVAFCLPKSLEAIQVIMGILAAGAAYVPLQFQGPPARLNAILRSTEPKLLMTMGRLADQLAADGGWAGVPVCRLAVSEAGQGFAPLLSGLAPDSDLPHNSPDDLAAIYFTSGSTGEPKGVMLSHGNIAAGVNLVVKCDELNDQDRILSHTSLHYAAYDMFFPIAIGCQTYLLSDAEAMLPSGAAAALERERVTVWRSTTTALRLLLESGELAARNLSCLRLLGVFGERLPLPLLRRLRAVLPARRFIFNYGATEAYRIACFDIPQNLPDDLVSLPIGTARPEYALSLRDEDDREVEDGAVGELCVEGAPVMLGYWKDVPLTMSRRISDRPHTWCTGDLMHRDAAGLLHLVGRKDHMVKIRGHRFDLGEIEAVLRGQPPVRDAVAVLVAKGGGDAEIHAAVLAEPSKAIRTAMRLACAKRLPAFARPSRIVMLQKFPMLASGKVDRMKLQMQLRSPSDGESA